MSQYDNVSVVKKANVYFDGKCVSHTVVLADGTKKTVGVILPSSLTFNTGGGAAIAFFQSVENFNTTLFTRGPYDTLTVYVFSKVRSGITPTINALALMLVVLTIVCATIYEIRRRSKAR